MGSKIKYLQFLLGFLVGFLTVLIASYLFISILTDYDYIPGLKTLQTANSLGKLITVSASINLLVFFCLLHYKRESMAWGLIAASVVLTIVTLFL